MRWTLDRSEYRGKQRGELRRTVRLDVIVSLCMRLEIEVDAERVVARLRNDRAIANHLTASANQ
jgi:hypothetical protein